MKIVSVCGNGCGTSLLLRMTIETALQRLNLQAEVEHTDLNSAASMDCDFLMAAADLECMLQNLNRRYAVVGNVLDADEVARAIQGMI